MSTRYTKAVQETLDLIEKSYGQSAEELNIKAYTKDETAEALAAALLKLPTNHKNLHATLNHSQIEECWEWQGAYSEGGGGYGLSSRSVAAASEIPGATVMNAHRRVMVLLFGERSVLHKDRFDKHGEPLKMHVDHACGNIRCANPYHLIIMPGEINIFKSKKQYCGWGHLLAGSPIYNGSVHCTECAKRRDRWVKDMNISKNAVKRAQFKLYYHATTDLVSREVLEARVAGAEAQLVKTAKRIARERASKPTKAELAAIVAKFSK